MIKKLESRQMLTIKNYIYTLNKPMTIGEYVIDVGDIITIVKGTPYHKYKEKRSDNITHIELPTEIRKFIEDNCKGLNGIFKIIEFEKIL